MTPKADPAPRESRVETLVDFRTQVAPILTKAGCNAGACHGAAAGRGGFKLSLLGANPASDYDAIVREAKGRRVNFDDQDVFVVRTIEDTDAATLRQRLHVPPQKGVIQLLN